MNNHIVFASREQRPAMVAQFVTSIVRQPLQAVTRYYEKVLERRLSNHQTVLLLNVQLAFVATVFPACSLLVRSLCMAWLVGALLKCRAEL